MKMKICVSYPIPNYKWDGSNFQKGLAKDVHDERALHRQNLSNLQTPFLHLSPLRIVVSSSVARQHTVNIGDRPF